MNDEQLHSGSTVWIKDGLDKGRKGVVDVKGFGQVWVVLEGETKVFSQTSVTTKDPNHIPLPPNFLPLDFKVGDKVEVSGHRNDSFNGIVGTVIGLPSYHTRTGDISDNRYKIRVSTSPQILWFAPELLKAAAPAERIEGNEIAHEDVQVGDTISVRIEATQHGVKEVNEREGVVASVSHSGSNGRHRFFARKPCGNYAPLNFLEGSETVVLLKKGESPNVAVVKELAAGTVIVKDSVIDGSVSTYVKSLNWHTDSQWHSVNSRSSISSTFVTDNEIVRLLDNGAKIVHTVKKVSF